MRLRCTLGLLTLAGCTQFPAAPTDAATDLGRTDAPIDLGVDSAVADAGPIDTGTADVAAVDAKGSDAGAVDGGMAADADAFSSEVGTDAGSMDVPTDQALVDLATDTPQDNGIASDGSGDATVTDSPPPDVSQDALSADAPSFDVGPADAPGADVVDTGPSCGPAPLTLCGAQCRDLSSDGSNCGACGRACTGGTCTAGSCVCPVGQQLCGTRCTDVMTDPSNCGACGYSVVSSGTTGTAGHRDCVGGMPSPAWVAITSSGGPLSPPHVAAWTGHRLLHVNDSEAMAYDPATDRWTAVPRPDFTTSPSFMHFASMPDRGQVFVWSAHTGAPSNASYIFDDSTSTPRWITVTLDGAPSARIGPGVVYNHIEGGRSDIFVLWGSSAGQSGGRYDLDAGSWTPIGSSGVSACSNSTHAWTHFTVANQLIVGFGGITEADTVCRGDIVNRLDPSSSVWQTALATGLTGRFGHTWLGVGSRVLFSGGSDGSGGGSPCSINGTWLVDPRGAAVSTTDPPVPSESGTKPYAMFTGRSAVVWGGARLACGGFFDHLLSGGSIGVVTATGIRWVPIPSTGQPSPRSFLFGDTEDSPGDTQHLWTGVEAIIYGGYNASHTALLGGARYQPPVSCVCPRNDDAPSWVPSPCNGVSGIVDTFCPR